MNKYVYPFGKKSIIFRDDYIISRALCNRLDDGHAKGQTGQLFGRTRLRAYRQWRRRRQWRGRRWLPVPVRPVSVPAAVSTRRQLSVPVAVPVRTAAVSHRGISAAAAADESVRLRTVVLSRRAVPSVAIPPNFVPCDVPCSAVAAAVRSVTHRRGCVPHGSTSVFQTARHRAGSVRPVRVAATVAAAFPGPRLQQTGDAVVFSAATRRHGDRHGRDQRRRTLATVRNAAGTCRTVRRQPISLLTKNVYCLVSTLPNNRNNNK